MSKIRFARSPKMPFYLPKNRLAEMYYCCLQMPLWKQELQEPEKNTTGIRQRVLESKIDLITETAQEVAGELADTIVENVTTEKPFYVLISRDGIPCSEKDLYAMREKFYYVLSHKLEKLEEQCS